jgi:hypothetical protein
VGLLIFSLNNILMPDYKNRSCYSEILLQNLSDFADKMEDEKINTKKIKIVGIITEINGVNITIELDDNSFFVTLKDNTTVSNYYKIDDKVRIFGYIQFDKNGDWYIFADIIQIVNKLDLDLYRKAKKILLKS